MIRFKFLWITKIHFSPAAIVDDILIASVIIRRLDSSETRKTGVSKNIN